MSVGVEGSSMIRMGKVSVDISEVVAMVGRHDMVVEVVQRGDEAVMRSNVGKGGVVSEHL